MVQSVASHAACSIRDDKEEDRQSHSSQDFSTSLKHCMVFVQLDGTARPSMMSELVETHTDKNGQIHEEENIAACTAVTYAGAQLPSLLQMSFKSLMNPDW